MESTEHVDVDMQNVHRFLVLGREDGTYITNNNIHREFSSNARSIDRMISNGRGVEVVEEIKSFSKEGRSPKQSPLLYALAICARSNDRRTKNAAYRCLSDICRIPTHLFMFIKFTGNRHNGRPGWGRAQRKAISEWYNQTKFQDQPLSLLRLGTKYKKRHTYSHRDLVRLAHVKPKTNHVGHVLKYLINGTQNYAADFDGVINEVTKLIIGMDKAKRTTRNEIPSLLSLIRKHDLKREHIPTNLLNSVDVWRALLYRMPLNAMIRNLGKMSNVGLLEHGSLEAQHVTERLLDGEKLKTARVHPLTILTAWNSYKRGESVARQQPMRWQVNKNIADVLETSFYKSFSHVEGTGKRILIAIDGGDDMLQPINGTPLVMARSGAVAIALLMSKIEPDTEFIQVTDVVVPVDISSGDNLQTASSKFTQLNGASAGIDINKAITWAQQNNKRFDAFVMFTASGNGYNTKESIQQYRISFGISRLVVVAMTSNRPPLTVSNDPHTLSVVGFDTKAFKVMFDFVRGII